MAELNLGHVVGPGVPTGGTSGQVLKKNSSTNFDTSWSANDATTIPMSSSDSTSINQAIANLNDATVVINVGSGKDLNNYTAQGVYRLEGNVTNSPDGTNYGLMQVYRLPYTSGYTPSVRQVFFPEANNRVFVRYYTAGANWSSWEELALNSKLSMSQVSASSITMNVGSVDSDNLGTKNSFIFEFRIKTNNVSLSSGNLLGTLAEGYRPRNPFYIPVQDYNTGKPINGSLYITNDGKITYYGDAISSTPIIAHATFVLYY